MLFDNMSLHHHHHIRLSLLCYVFFCLYFFLSSIESSFYAHKKETTTAPNNAAAENSNEFKQDLKYSYHVHKNWFLSLSLFLALLFVFQLTLIQIQFSFNRHPCSWNGKWMCQRWSWWLSQLKIVTHVWFGSVNRKRNGVNKFEWKTEKFKFFPQNQTIQNSWNWCRKNTY